MQKLLKMLNTSRYSYFHERYIPFIYYAKSVNIMQAKLAQLGGGLKSIQSMRALHVWLPNCSTPLRKCVRARQLNSARRVVKYGRQHWSSFSRGTDCRRPVCCRVLPSLSLSDFGIILSLSLALRPCHCAFYLILIKGTLHSMQLQTRQQQLAKNIELRFIGQITLPFVCLHLHSQ